MRLTIIITCIAFIASGCTTISSMNESNYDEQANNSLFEKKQMCAAYSEQLEEKIEEENSKLGLYFLSLDNGNTAYLHLNKLFYSPKADSCLYVTQENLYSNEAEMELTYITYTLTDYLTGEIITSEFVEWGGDDYYTLLDKFENTVEEYENIPNTE